MGGPTNGLIGYETVRPEPLCAHHTEKPGDKPLTGHGWDQGYAFWALWTRSLVWPVLWPKGPLLYASAFLLYVVGTGLMNGMLTSEFVRKTQLEADQIAAQQIQQTLQPGALQEITGYEVKTFYAPFRDVGGDYFDVIELNEDDVTILLVKRRGDGALGSRVGEGHG